MPLPRLSRLTRCLTLLFAAMQIATPAFVSVADGARDRSVREEGSHVEQFGQNACTPPHSADCAACRFLSGNVGDVSPTVSMFVSTDVAPAPGRLVAVGSAAARDGFNSRAPPILLG